MPVDTALFPIFAQSGVGYPAAIQLASSMITGRTTTPTPAAGANNGGTPPAPSLRSGSTDTTGAVLFGSGTIPAAGEQVVVTFGAAYGAAPLVILVSGNTATLALGALGATSTTTTFTIRCTTAPAASQAGTTFQVNYLVLP